MNPISSRRSSGGCSRLTEPKPDEAVSNTPQVIPSLMLLKFAHREIKTPPEFPAFSHFMFQHPRLTNENLRSWFREFVQESCGRKFGKPKRIIPLGLFKKMKNYTGLLASSRRRYGPHGRISDPKPKSRRQYFQLMSAPAGAVCAIRCMISGRYIVL
jgi:hypothetical protein